MVDNKRKENKEMPKLTMKEMAVYSLAYFNVLDENGELKETKMNKIRYKLSCWIAGGEQELEKMCVDIYGKLKEQGFEV